MERREAIKLTGMVLGYSVSGAALQGLLHGCSPQVILDWEPLFFSKKDAMMVGEIAEIIIPESETPGAKAAGVPHFIDLMLHAYYSKNDQETFINGLNEMTSKIQSRFDKEFSELKQDEKEGIINELHAEALKEYKPFERAPMILILKELTILGFFTSEIGASKVLQYIPVPGRYQGCIPWEKAS